ncbi:hypothetical protein B0H11DRAFT_1923391 [Mycena galericulata]|nr:hypothetical protein B0H11DRAFT_1923391 [Mycena galericulata]
MGKIMASTRGAGEKAGRFLRDALRPRPRPHPVDSPATLQPASEASEKDKEKRGSGMTISTGSNGLSGNLKCTGDDAAKVKLDPGGISTQPASGGKGLEGTSLENPRPTNRNSVRADGCICRVSKSVHPALPKLHLNPPKEKAQKIKRK